MAHGKRLNIQEALDRAVRHHNAGRLPEAEIVYRKILKTEPRNPFALHLLGVIAHQFGDSQQALQLMTQAIAVNPDYAGAHCNLGMVYKALGQLEGAVASYRRAIALDPGDAQAHNNLGNVHQAMGRFDAAIESYERAVALDPDYVNALSNLALALMNTGRLADALARCRQALEIEPDYANAHTNLGLALHQQGALDAAIASFRQAIVCDGGDAEAHNNLGNALQENQRLDDAVDCYRRAIACAPEYVDAHNNLGNALHELDRHDDAVACYQAVLELEPENADAHNNLGLVFQDQGRFADAVASYRKALDADRDYANAHANIGLPLIALGRNNAALAHFRNYLDLTRGPDCVRPADNRFSAISKAKIDHDIEQLRYLEVSGGNAARFGALARLYEDLREEIVWPRGTDFLVQLTPAQRRRIGASYNRPVNLIDAPEVPGPALNDNLDAAKITRDYFENQPGMTYFDGLLSLDALAMLRRFLLESTIWFDFKYRGGYLGAFLNDGLASPLILQIAEEFRRKFPGIFQDYRLMQCWAYKYDSGLKGIQIHADAAAINVNFWITPDSANLNAGNGGLVVHKVEAPLDWRFASYNADQDRIRRFLAEHDAGKLVVPHGENRAVLFNSDLFHETDIIDFKTGYKNRRINVTMLFGLRQD